MKKVLAIGLAILTSACADNPSLLVDYGATDTKAVQKTTPASGYHALEQAALCCDSLSELDYQPIPKPGTFTFNITQKNTAFNFSTGKSFVQGITLPKANGAIKLTVSAPIVNSVFVPTVLVLDEQYKPIQVYGKKSIAYDKASLLNVDRFFGEIELPALFANGQQAKYLVVLTTEEAMKGTTKLPAPDPSAIELGRAELVYKKYNNEPIAHTAIGTFKIAFAYLANSQTSAQEMVSETATDNSQQQAQALLTEEKKTAETPASSVIQPETEARFIRLIEQAIKDGESDKALRFVEEAELAGSSKARDALFNALKKLKK